ncbi:DDE domain protein (plasmid) [Agrobacterium sp. RAC06]|nr:DDE domain protein [Agrobacterium sp. RAC06]
MNNPTLPEITDGYEIQLHHALGHDQAAAATNFFARTIENNGWPEKVVIDKSGANLAGLQNMNILLLLRGWLWLIEVLQAKYLNNMIEQDHRFIKKLTRPMKGFKSFQAASATLDGMEVAHMIRKEQFATNGHQPFNNSPPSPHNCVQR